MSEESVLYIAAKSLGKLASKIGEATEDGKISIGEIVNMVIAGGEVTILGIKNYRDLISSVADGIDEEEKEQIKEAFAEGFDVQNNVAEENIEAFLNGAVDLICAIAAMYAAKKAK